MRGSSLLSILMFIVGAALLYQGIRMGQGEVYLVVVFPVFVLSGPVSLLGALLIFVSAFVAFLSLAGFFSGRLGAALEGLERTPRSTEQLEPKVRKRRFGGFLLLGPIPVVFGSDVKITTAMLALAVVLTVALLFLFLLS